MKRKMVWLLVCLLVCFGVTACQNYPANELETAETAESPGTVDAGEMSTEMSDTGESETAETETTETTGRGSIHRDDPVEANGDVVQSFKLGTTVTVDLDGDGVDELLTVKFTVSKYYDLAGFGIQIDDSYFDKNVVSGWSTLSSWGVYYYLVDLDTEDNWKEIMVLGRDIDAGNCTMIYRYSNGNLVCTGRIDNGRSGINQKETEPKITGDGIITNKAYMWIVRPEWVEKRWRLINGSSLEASIEEIVPDFYDFLQYRNEEETHNVLQEMPVYEEKRESEEAVRLLPVGTKLEFIRYYPEGQWLECRCDGGEDTVWVKLEDEIFMPVNVNWNGLSDYFDYMNFAG